MTEVGEGVIPTIIKLIFSKYLFAGVTEVRFNSGIDIYDVDSRGGENKIPATGSPHWGGRNPIPAVYVRQGGSGETKALKVKVKWNQKGCAGSATLEGRADRGTIEVKGTFTISGDTGETLVDCTFDKKPTVVRNYGDGLPFDWTVTSAGETASCIGGSPLKLFFVDKKPKPINWSYYKTHYLKVIDWATKWAERKSGSSNVRAAIWSKFSDGSKAKDPIGYAYWKTNNPIQDLKSVVLPSSPASSRGWSCRAIAHLFMECMALHGISVVEVMPQTPNTAHTFLVQNWHQRSTTFPNWPSRPNLYYGGSWISISTAPLNKKVSTSLKKGTLAAPCPKCGATIPANTLRCTRPKCTGKLADPGRIKVDMAKRPGVRAQGQNNAPLMFNNHWIVETEGRLYDTSYGMKHPNSISTYASNAIAGWLVDVKPDTYQTGFWLWVSTHSSNAFLCHKLSMHTLQRNNLAQN